MADWLRRTVSVAAERDDNAPYTDPYRQLWERGPALHNTPASPDEGESEIG